MTYCGPCTKTEQLSYSFTEICSLTNVDSLTVYNILVSQHLYRYIRILTFEETSCSFFKELWSNIRFPYDYIHAGFFWENGCGIPEYANRNKSFKALFFILSNIFINGDIDFSEWKAYT